MVFEVDVCTARTRLLAGAPNASYGLMEYQEAGSALCRRSLLDGSVEVVRMPGDQVTASELPPRPEWRGASLVRWQADELSLEGMFVPPATGDPPWMTVVFLHGGPVGSLVVGEAERAGAWADPRWATFIPDFPASGICGEAAMLSAFEAAELPERDHEVDAVLAGVDHLVQAGMVDETRLFLVGHSYGAYLVNRALTRTDRFRAAVCWEGVADLRMLDGASLAHQVTWRGGGPEDAPARWSAASPIDRVDRVRTPTLLFYGADSRLVRQGKRWGEALREAGVPTQLVIEDGVGHTFVTTESSQCFQDVVSGWFLQHLDV